MAGSNGKGKNRGVAKERIIAHPRPYLTYPDLDRQFKTPLLKVIVKEHTIDRGRSGSGYGGGGKLQVYPGDILIDRLDWLAEMEGLITVAEGIDMEGAEISG